MISFQPLESVLKSKGWTKSQLKTRGIIGGATYTRIVAAIKTPVNEGISISAIDRICKALECQPGDIMEYIPDTQEAVSNE